MADIAGSSDTRGGRFKEKAPVIASVACSIAVSVLTFVNVIGVPVVGGDFEASFLQIGPFISQLNEQYGPWLPQMMQEPAGSNMSFLLRVASVALKVVSLLSVLAIPAFIVFFALCVKKRLTAARVVGVTAFAVSAIGPLLLVVAQLIVNGQFSCGVFEPAKILSVLPSGYAWIVFSAVGIVAAIRCTSKRYAAE